jgi:hypothetical protein
MKTAARVRGRHAPRRLGAGGPLLAAALLLLWSGPCPALAQSTVSVLPVQGLRFGTLLPGAPSIVSPLDGQRRASLELVGTGHVTLVFELPAGLAAGGDARLPLRFGPGDGRITFPRSNRVIEFDPTVPVSFQIPPGTGGATVYLGGAAEPALRQPPGSYSGALTVQVLVANAAT